MYLAKMDFDLTDKGWVDLYVQKCENIMKEFTNYVYALQNQCLKERSRCEQLDRNCKRLQMKLSENQKQTECQYENNNFMSTPNDRKISKNRIETTPTEAEGNRSTRSDCSPAFLDMAMDSEQLQMETTGALSPAQRIETVLSSEQLTSPSRHSLKMDSVFQHNTSPSYKLKNNNENKSALGFLKARGRRGKVLCGDSKEPKLREQNCSKNEDACYQWKQVPGKLLANRPDWIGKNPKSVERTAGIKRTATTTNIDELRKRRLMSLNKSSQPKLKQSSLTQMVALKGTDVWKPNNSPSAKVVDEAQKLSLSPTIPIAAHTSKQLSFSTLPSDTDDIFHFSSDDDDCDTKSRNVAIQQNIKVCNDTTYLQPLPNETENIESVLLLSPTAPPIICLDESDDNEQPTDTRMLKKTSKQVGKANTKKSNVVVKQEKPSIEKVPSSVAAAMIADWDEEPEDEKKPMSTLTPKTYSKYATSTTDVKPRLSQLPGAKISIKECFNIDCDECQKYINFMGSNMSLAEVEAHLRRCTRHRTAKDYIPVTPPDYWNPLMPTFSESDPRNRTLLEDPCLQRKRGSNQS